MLKILYAASDSYSAKIRMMRFLRCIDGKYNVKVAAYKKSGILDIVDWTLDSIKDVASLKYRFDSDNLAVYYNQVKQFKPDLIISDLEPYTSYIAKELNIKIWQVNPKMLFHGMDRVDKHYLCLRYNFSILFNYDCTVYITLNDALNTADRKFVYSHFMDAENTPKLNSGYEWVRPYYLIGDKSKPCNHEIVGATLTEDRKPHIFLNKFNDPVLFSNFDEEKYDKLVMKNLDNELEYICNLTNSNLFLCQGHDSFLADAFYNRKYSLIMPDFNDIECLLGTYISKRCKTGIGVYGTKKQNIVPNKIKIHYKKEVKFLHEYLDEL